MSQPLNNQNPPTERRKTRRSLRLQIMSIAVIGTLGFFLYLGVMLLVSKDRADLLMDIRDRHYPVQENLLDALHTLKFIDTNIEQATFSGHRALLDHSEILAQEFRSHLQATKNLDSQMSAEISQIEAQFEIYFGTSISLAESVINKKSSILDIIPAKQNSASEFNNIIEALATLETTQNNTLVNSVNSATAKAREAVDAGVITGLLTAGLVFLVALLTTRSILYRIQFMVQSLKQIATGTGDMNVRIPLSGADEMTDLAYWFNTFIEKLQRQSAESTAEIERLAFTDTLTSLPNRRMFLRCLSDEMEYVNSHQGKSLAVLFLDLDNFKPVNDQLGHEAGDELIRTVAKRLVDTTRESDVVSSNTEPHSARQSVVARLAGDEFMIIITNLDHPQQVEKIAQRIRSSVTQPITINHMECAVGVSIGICQYPGIAKDANELVTFADMAMYDAKNHGKNTYRFFDPKLRAATDHKVKIDNAIKDAIKNQELHLLFQPKIRLSDRQVVGAEALLRWDSKELGAFGPAEFLAQAEANGRICEFDDWVLESVIEHLDSWHKQGWKDINIALNFSAFQASRADLGVVVERVTIDKEYLLPHLEIEITETSAVKNISTVERNIIDLKFKGVRIAMDDFGAGSSLTLLTRCAIDTLKIDRDFTKDICTDAKSRIIVEAIIDLATQLKVDICAEGIEHESQAKVLNEMNCEYAQGFYFSTPLTATEFTAYLKAHNFSHNKAA